MADRGKKKSVHLKGKEEKESKKGQKLPDKNIKSILKVPGNASESTPHATSSGTRQKKVEDKGEEEDWLSLHHDFEDTDPNIEDPPEHSKPEAISEVFKHRFKSSEIFFKEYGTPKNIKEVDHELLDAALCRNLTGVQNAIEQGADINTFRDRTTALLTAVEYGDCQMVRFLLSVSGINTNFPDYFGRTPLSIAIVHNCDQIAKDLLSNNADPKIADNLGKTPLHEAVFHGKTAVVRLLIAFNANVNAADCFGQRPLYLCVVLKPNLECLRLLLAAGAEPEFPHISGMTLLSRAILETTPLEILEELMEHNVLINAQDLNAGRSPLHIAAIMNNLEVTQILIAKGANPNLITSYNLTPLDLAIFHNSLDVAKYLTPLTSGSDEIWLQAMKKKRIM